MTDFTDEDVLTREERAIAYAASTADADQICDAFRAVLPAHDRRVRAEALREAADHLEREAAKEAWDQQGGLIGAAIWLRARADAEEGQ